MLILSRREAESVCLGDDVVLTIVAVGNDKVRIGVQAPPGIRILRNELEVEVSMLPFKLRQAAAAVSPLMMPASVEQSPPKSAEVLPLDLKKPAVEVSAPLTALVRRAVANRRAA